ncbi:hypothetical protein R5R35_013763 [Gryllus longicercus]|uniref:Probable arginine--tRNA ligase, mitochondrial n=1 Tax=Gryllus longicercus TaxID=2509291 RepID=A0AAN9Z8R0_9ORTH
MASKFKHHVSRRIMEALKLTGSFSSSIHANLSRHLLVASNKDGVNFELVLPLKPLSQTLNSNVSFNGMKLTDLKYLSSDDKISAIAESHNESLIFTLNRNLFVKEVLNDKINKPYPYSKILDVAPYPFGKTVIVEYSSPNIAKPFHIGHLRSTIIGNFIAKIHEHLSCNVVKINYLGDWGTQLGLLKVGLDMAAHSPEALKQNPIQLLFEAYVKANKAAASDPNVAEQARNIFYRLEQGDTSELEKWTKIREYTVTELEGVYRRLGVVFNEYAWESMYGAKEIQSVVNMLNEKCILDTQEDGKKAVCLNEKQIPLLKSDGSTLYLVRDIAAAIDRFEKHKFEEMIYVVDNAQTDHFVALFGTLKKMQFPWANQLRHIKFGRVHGMSTRSGNVVFLKDILDKTRKMVEIKQQQSPTTKVNLQKSPEITDILGVSAIIINDLKQRRQRDYEFDWDRATQIQGDTGIRLQYTHCRLWNLEKNSGATLPHDCDPSVLTEQEATQLVQQIARFDDVLKRSYEELEACILVNYLFKLCNAINRAFKTLPIKGQDNHIASQRLMLFHASRLILNQGLRILGIQPLQEM